MHKPSQDKEFKQNENDIQLSYIAILLLFQNLTGHLMDLDETGPIDRSGCNSIGGSIGFPNAINHGGDGKSICKASGRVEGERRREGMYAVMVGMNTVDGNGQRDICPGDVYKALMVRIH